jgi:hypothetical protein
LILDYYSPAYLSPLVEEIQRMYWEDNKNTKEHKEKTNQAISCILNQAVKEVAYGRNKFSITLDRSAYSQPLIYNGVTVDRKVGYRPMVRVIDWMAGIGLIDKVVGGVESWNYDNGKFVPKQVVQSSVTLSEYLIEKVRPYAERRRVTVIKSVIEVRDKDGNIVPKRLDPYNKAMVNLYTQFNKSLRDFNISIDGESIDFQVRKIYNNSSLEQGGRVYGCEDPLIYSNLLPRDNRERILIDNDKTVELDFKYLHIALLCERDGIILPDDFDPYQIDLSGFSKKGARWIGKKASLIMINAGVGLVGMGALGKEVNDDNRTPQLRQDGDIPSGKISRKGVFDAILSRNPYLRKYADNPVGMELQNLDSKIMDNIIAGMMAVGEVVVPVHDSIVVRQSVKGVAEEVMSKAYLIVMGSDNNCRIEVK